MTAVPGSVVLIRLRHDTAGGDYTEWTGRATGVPGLAAFLKSNGVMWGLAHERSGLSLGWYSENPELVVAFAHDIGLLTDWSAPAAEHHYDGDLWTRVNTVAAGIGMTRRDRPLCDSSLLADLA